MSEPKFRAYWEAKIKAFGDARKLDLGQVSERDIRLEMAPAVCPARVPVELVWLVAQGLHTCILHPMLRRQAKQKRAANPAQLELWPELREAYWLERDGFERSVDLADLSRPEVLRLAEKLQRISKGVAKWSRRADRQGRQLLEWFQETHPDEPPWTEQELAPFEDAELVGAC